jgi:hypothetical protein
MRSQDREKIMKAAKIILGSFILITVTASAARAQQQFTQTVTAQNKSCNATCTVLDISALNNNRAALIFVTPVLVNGANLNPHLIGAYYMYLNKWSIFNLDGVAMAVGATFSVEYYANSDTDHFVYIVPQLVHSNDIAYIDHAGLNNNPTAQIRIFPTSPPAAPALYNHYDTGVSYDASAGKWLIANINNAPMASGAAYNVASSSLTLLPALNTGVLVPLPTPTPGTAGQQGTPFLPAATLAPPAASSPNGSAGGDLSGAYPNPKVIGLQGKPISSNAPTIGQVLKWNGTAWEPAGDNVGSASQTSTTAKPSALFFNQSAVVTMNVPNVNSLPITGLNNQTFTLAQSSRVVFHTAIDIRASTVNIIDPGATGVWLSVEILNASNAVVAKSTSDAVLGTWVTHSINSSGIGILPAGPYHTRVSINRQSGGAMLDVTGGFGDHPSQGGQMILEIFPD